MSEDGSPTGGHQPNQQEVDQNSSLMEIVCSRVTSIIPQSFSKWFSPTAAGDDGSRNGSARRRRLQLLDDEQYPDVDDSDCEEVDVVDRAPPSKRSKLNISEEYSSTDSFQISQPNITNNFLSSTPTTIRRRKHLGFKSVHQPPNNITSVTSSAAAARSMSELRSLSDFDTDVLEVIPENRESTSEIRHTSSRRHLNIPLKTTGLRNLRRPSLKTIRESEASASFHATQSPYLQNEEEDDNQDYINIDESGKIMKNDLEKIISNGVRSSPNIITVDTTSESGESQSSSVQKKKVSGLFGAGAKRLRTSTGSGLNYATHLQGKKSLFCDKNMPSNLNNSTTSLTSLNRRQSFNASLYGSTSALSDSRLLNKYSPFYNGCTTYGGASAYSKYSQNAQRTIRMPTLIRPSSSMSTLSSSTTSLAQNTDSTSALSNTAKRILELMNQFTTPLGDAKKMANNTKVPTLIAHRQRFSDVDRTANKGIRMAMPKTPYSRLMATTSNSKQQLTPPINELQVPSMSQLLQMKNLQNNTEKVREITNQSKSVLNREEEYKLPIENQNVGKNASAKHVNKIKNKLTSTRNSTKSGHGTTEETVQAVVLPDISLPLLESVPKIDIEISEALSNIQSTEKSIKVHVSQPKDAKNNTASTLTFSSNVNSLSKSQSNAKFADQTTLQKEANVISNDVGFKFSSPIEVVSALAKNTVEPISNFKFSDPFPVSRSPTALNSASNFKYQLNSNSIKPQSIASNNATAGMTASTQLKTGSVLDMFKKVTPTEKTLTSDSTFGGQFKITSDKWECLVCLVRNENSVDKCVACENARKKLEPAGNKLFAEIQPKSDIKSTFGDKFKPSSDTWECSMCMIRNKSDINECLACKSAKPGAIKSPITSELAVVKTTDAGFKSIIAQQSEKWECSACMARNESIRNKCQCCEQTKPGIVSDSVPQFSFGTTASKFTFGFTDKKEEELKNDGGSNKIEIKPMTSAIETKSGFSFGAKPVEVTEPHSFSFGVKPTGESITPATSSVNKDEIDKPSDTTIKFGMPVPDAKPESHKAHLDKKELEPTTSFKFGSSASTPSFSQPAAKPPNDTKESSVSSIFQPIGGFAFGNTDKKEAPAKPVFGFGMDSKSTTEISKSSTSIGGFNLTNSLGPKKDEIIPPDSKNLFAFGSPATKSDTKPAEKSSGFSFASSATTSAFKSPLSQKPSSELSVATTKNELTSAPTFVFGKSSTPVSVTPTFGAISSNAITSSSSSNAVSTAPSFGGLASTVSSSTVSSFKPPSNPASLISTPSFGSSSVTAVQPQQTIKFGNSFSASNSTSDNKANNTNLYSFGGGNKTETVTPMFGNVSSTTTTTNKLFTFGGNASTTSAPTTTASSTPFLFGASNIQKHPTESSSAIFGSATTNPTQNITNSPALPAFTSFASPLTTPQQSQPPAFGQTSSMSTPFGTNVNNSAPTFGSIAAAPMFGSSVSVPTFGSTSSAFGATNNSTFGNSSMKPTFGNGFGAGATQTVDDSSAAKKPTQGFNFSAASQNSAATFSFGSNNHNNNNNNNKQPFAFSASSAPTFNFTGSSEATNSSQPFQFGATPITPAAFNFSGVETAANAPFQFSAAQAANNIFAVTPGAPQTAQPLRRKTRTAVTRRTQQR